MTIEKLVELNFPMNQWSNFSSLCSAMLLDNDGYIHISPKGTQYFIEEESGLIFVRNIKSPLSKTKSKDSVLVIVKSDGEEMYGKLYEGGVIDKKNSNIGKYHAVYDIESITGIIF